MSFSRHYFKTSPFELILMGESASSRRGEERKKEGKKRKGKGKLNLSRKVSYLESSLSHVAVGAITCYCNWTNTSGLIHSL